MMMSATETPTRGTVVSADGTSIAYSRVGNGPAVILVDGALGHRGFGPCTPLAERLSGHFTVITYDRRGRGESGDTQPYSPEREIEDLRALVALASEPVYLWGISSGAALALEAANSGLPVRKLAIYENPAIVDDARRPVRADYRERLEALVAAGRRGAG